MFLSVGREKPKSKHGITVHSNEGRAAADTVSGTESDKRSGLLPMRKKTLSLIAVLVAMAMILTACGSNGSQTDPSPYSEPASAPQQTESSEPPQESAPTEQETSEQPAESSTPDEPEEPETPAPEMIEITMDNWQEYFDLGMYFVDGDYPSYEGRLVLKEEYSKAYMENGDYMLPENDTGSLRVAVGSGQAYANGVEGVTATIKVSYPDYNWYNIGPGEYTASIDAVSFLAYIMQKTDSVSGKLQTGSNSLFVYEHNVEEIEQNGHAMNENIILEMIDISGTIPVWVEK